MKPRDSIVIRAVEGFGEVGDGHDIAATIARLAPELADGDIVVITSKIVSKSEGRVLAAVDREAAIDAETVRTVAITGATRIVETRQGLVMAAAGVDASNLAVGTIALLPVDPDESARLIRARLRKLTGRKVAVVVTDTAGRAWREGQVDMGIGAAGLLPLVDLRGNADTHGRILDATVTAVVDEIAAAADLVKGKTSHLPVATLTGLAHLVTDEDGPGARAVIRPAETDLFRLGTAEAIRAGSLGAVAARRSVRAFTDRAVEPELIATAVAAALTAPAPHHTTPFRFVRVEAVRQRLLDSMAEQWSSDLRSDGLDEAAVEGRVRRGDLLRTAPCLVVPCLVRDGSHHYPDQRRADAERRMFDLAAGAAIEGFLVQLTGLGLAACWVSSTLFCADVAASALDLPPGWEPLGAVAIGWPKNPVPPRGDLDPASAVLDR